MDHPQHSAPRPPEPKHSHGVHHTKNFFDILPSKQAFWLGFATAVLSIGTLGFIILGSCMLQGDCGVTGIAAADSAGSGADTVKAADVAAAPAAAVAAGTIPVVTDGDYIRGDVNAPITIIEYSDFECPYCERFHPTMEQVMEDYAGQVRWVLRSFPLSFHPNAEDAGVAAECAGQQGKFWEMGDELFANRARLGDDFYYETAAKLGLNAGTFTTCYEGDEARDKIQKQAQDGASAGVTGTPGSFIIDQDGNATPIKGALPYSSVAAAIDSML
ncbi:thioredoxin domain-containing protein [Candidatus Uhrbacteria bacterium]|jgi:protein-disulfide isomerase|nr:thioredoxin domain-containing protein [Candidatus Uhrbacteria bacterium]